MTSTRRWGRGLIYNDGGKKQRRRWCTCSRVAIRRQPESFFWSSGRSSGLASCIALSSRDRHLVQLTATQNDGCCDGSYENSSRDDTIASDGSRREPQSQNNYSDDGLHNPTSGRFIS
jgi:hypothetical protein